MRPAIGVLVCCLVLAVPGETAPLLGQEPMLPQVGLDHIILAAGNLTRGLESFSRRTGVTPERGGAHPGRGTENALVALGEGRYLEILAPIAPPSDSVAAGAPLLPRGWALHTGDIAGVIALLRAAGFTVLGPLPGSRRKPDGSVLEWQTASVSGPGLELAPFLIQWAAGTPHPSSTSPAGCRLLRFELTEPGGARLAAFFRAVGYRASLHTSGERGMRLMLHCPSGDVTF